MVDMDRFEREIDCDRLQKGDVVAVDRIEVITQTKFGTTAYGLAALGLCQEIERRLATRKHDAIETTIRTKEGNIQVCTDVDASYINESRFAKAARSMRSAIRRHCAVDVTKLPADRVQKHDRNGQIMAGGFNALMVHKDVNLVLDSHTRAVPGLPGN